MRLKTQILKMVLLAAIFGVGVFLLPLAAFADNYGDKITFIVDKNYDSSGRSKVSASLVWVGAKIYFYTDDQWWDNLDAAARQNYNNSFQILDQEFSKNIQPKLTALLGTDINPVVNHDGMLTVLIHPMVKDAGGYINTGDGYSRYQSSVSNEREMIYFNTRFIDSPLAKSYLAHEFTHLITFNQKDRLRNITEDVWLNEARADYASTILGYDAVFEGSNFDQRVRSFSADSAKSLVEWLNKPSNYGAAHLFMQYLADQYGTKIISDSMNSDEIGIASIDYAFKKNGFDIDFVQVFRNWLITVLANDCRLGSQYCYKYADLRDFGVAPRINYLPNSDQVSLTVMYNTGYFAGNWQKIVGGNGDLTLEFLAAPQDKFIVPYLMCYPGGECRIGQLLIDNRGGAVLKMADFGRQYASLTLMPFASGKAGGFNNATGNLLSYTIKISVSPAREALGKPVPMPIRMIQKSKRCWRK